MTEHDQYGDSDLCFSLTPYLATNQVDCMFAGTRIKSVTLPDSLTSLSERAFDDDVKLGPPTHPLVVKMHRR